MVLAHLNLLRKIVGILGNFIALCLFLSPTPTFVRIVKKKSVEEYSPIPYLATLINCLVWVLYGLPAVHPDSMLVVTINSTGIVIEIVFLTIFFVYCGRQKQRLVISAVLAAETAFIAILAVLVFTLQHTTDKRTMSVGIVCCVFNVMMYASPLSVMKMVIKTKSVEFMPFWLSVAGFLNASIWTIYAVMPFDPFMAIPNGIGCLFGLAQLILYGAYYRSTKKIMAEREKQPSYIGLSTAVAHIEPEKIENFNQQINSV
ncbi:PREDICTED: bidirectional sugar transporter SWEET7-like [Camelina sativa]|uniref:Bidirectional sugar transporter SWEET n=1 Tax=Camelina sativa TaxID=90675 RepID=A0ABM0U6L0_CAMSA|nr:PREDICTED: bidirectional sugar transporter SWEET7-like [Camelina sativa]